MKKQTITIAGKNGSGKSTAARGVAMSLGFQHFSGGDFMREIAKEKGLTMEALGYEAKKDHGVIDKLIDLRQKEFMSSNNKFVIDSRLGWFWDPESFKVFLNLDEDTSAKRVFEDMKKNPTRSVEQALSIEETKKLLADRLDSERARYQEYYGIKDHHDLSHYDLVIDTAANNIEQVQDIIIREYKKWLNE